MFGSNELLLLSAPSEDNKLKHLINRLQVLPREPQSRFVASLMAELLEHDHLTYQHSIEVGVMVWAMASILGLANPELCLHLGLTHDIGKLAIPSKALSLRFIAHWEQMLQVVDGREVRVPFHYHPPDEERVLLRKHGIYGESILQALGFDEQFQIVARDHARPSFAFTNKDSIELQLVVIADWFSAMKDPGRNRYRGTDLQTLPAAVARMDRQFDDPSTTLSAEVKAAFHRMVALGIYPVNETDGKAPDRIYQIYRHCVSPAPTVQELCMATGKWSILRWEPTMPNLRHILQIMRDSR